MTVRLTRIELAAAVLAAGALAAGCAAGQPGGVPGPSGSAPTSSVSETPSGREITVSGQVERAGIEGGCLLLRANPGQVYELAGGSSEVLRPGVRATVTGRLRPDLATICQLGPVLEVVTVHTTATADR